MSKLHLIQPPLCVWFHPSYKFKLKFKCLKLTFKFDEESDGKHENTINMIP